jgi:hypothetical protein
VLAGILVLVIAALAFFAGNLLLRGGVETTADPATLTGQYSSAVDGYTLSLPQGWQAAGGAGFRSPIEGASVIIASRAGLRMLVSNSDRMDFLVSEPIFLALTTDTAGAPGILPLPRLILDTFKSDIPPRDELSFGITRGSTVNGRNAVYADFSGRSLDGNIPFAGRIVTVPWANRVGFFIGVAPAEQWEAFHPTFNAMIRSIGLYEPAAVPGS